MDVEGGVQIGVLDAAREEESRCFANKSIQDNQQETRIFMPDSIAARDLQRYEEAYKMMEVLYHQLISRGSGSCSNSLLSARFVDGARRLKVYADHVESSNGVQGLRGDYTLPSLPRYQRTLTKPDMMQMMCGLDALPIDPLVVISSAIGACCGTYAPLHGRSGHLVDNLLSGTKRKVCVNNSCATRRHKATVRADAERIAEWILSEEARAFLPKVWVHLEGDDEIKLTGHGILKKLLSDSPLDVNMAHAVVRMLREQEAQTLFLRNAYPGRHFVSPFWGVNVAHGATCLEVTYNQFMLPAPRYDIKHCSIVLTLTCSDGEWSCYAFDFNRSVVSIMDPNIRQPVMLEKIQQHSDFTRRLLTHVVFCMRLATGDPTIGRSVWTPKLLLAGGRRPQLTTNSGIEAINCMRWYNGDTVCTPPKDRIAMNTRRDLALQLISIETNVSNTPVLLFALRR